MNKTISTKSAEWRSALELIRSAALKMDSSREKISPYQFLTIVYSVYFQWREQRTSQRLSKATARALGIKTQHRTGAIRILIDAGCSRDAKTKNRWSRALERAAADKITPKKLGLYFAKHKGIAGVARLAALQDPRRIRPERDDWTE